MYGIHINSDPNIIIDEINEIESYNHKYFKCVQLFVNNSNKYKDVYNKFKDICKEKLINIIVHLSYTINIGQTWDEYSWWITQLILEIELSIDIGAKFVVLHLGKSLDLDINIALNNMFSCLLYISNKLKHKIPENFKILLETSSGQGSEMCINLEDLSNFINKLLNNKNNYISNLFGICIDTCHIFNAGYDLNTTTDVIKYIKEFDKLIGIKNIKLIHLNNSKTPLGSKIDRHDNLNTGQIKLEGIKEIIKFAYKLDIPIILETPDDFIDEDIELINHFFKF